MRADLLCNFFLRRQRQTTLLRKCERQRGKKHPILQVAGKINHPITLPAGKGYALQHAVFLGQKEICLSDPVFRELPAGQVAADPMTLTVEFSAFKCIVILRKAVEIVAEFRRRDLSAVRRE